MKRLVVTIFVFLLSSGEATVTVANDGTLKWAFEMGNSRSCPAIGYDGTVYIGSTDNNLYAINPDGTEKWAFTANGPIVRSSPTIGYDGTIYVGAEDTYLYAINPDGTLKWRFRTPNAAVQQSPALGSDGTIYLGAHGNNGVYAINPDGSQKWRFETGHSMYSPVIGLDGTIYVGGEDDYLYAINPDGSQKWRFETGDWIRSAPAIGSDGTIYIGSRDDYLYAINPNGTLKWTFQTGSDVDYSPAIGLDGSVYVCSEDRNLYVINPDGTLKWAFAIGNYGSSPAIGLDGTIYVGSSIGLDAINPDGTQRWSFPMPVDGSPNIGCDGTVYIGSRDHNLYAINGNSGGVANTPWPVFQHDVRHTGRSDIIPENQPPIANAGPDQIVECADPTGTLVTLDGSGSTDPDDDIVSFEWYEGEDPLGSGETMTYSFDLGVHAITLVVTDSFDETDSDEVIINLQDTTLPEIDVSVSPDTLWPPNHKMVYITTTVTATDNCDANPLTELESITMNEGDETDAYDPNYDSAISDGDTSGDIQVDENGDIHLRAERSGKSDGRNYTITYSSTDVSGNSSTASATVTVPHNQ